MSGDWVDPVLRGVTALAITALLFGAARIRFRGRGGGDAPSDTGLD